MMPPKRMRKKTRNEISTGLKRAAHSRPNRLAFASLGATTKGAAISTSWVGTGCISCSSEPAKLSGANGPHDTRNDQQDLICLTISSREGKYSPSVETWIVGTSNFGAT